MIALDSAPLVVSLGPILTLTLAVGALLAFTSRHRRIGTVMASGSLLLLAAAFVV